MKKTKIGSSFIYLWIALILVFVLIGVISYSQMFHMVCILSLLLALVTGAFFTMSVIRRYTDALKKQEELRRRLTSDVAHELRTPLTAVSSHLELMIDGIWEPSAERLQSCYDEIGRITGLVADMEKLREAESESLALSKEPVDLLQLCKTVCENFESESTKKSIALTCDGASSTIFADKDRLAQVVTNLLSNAIKYTPEGGTVRMTVENDSAHGKITVEDSGIGIPKDELPYVFERFYRVDKSRMQTLLMDNRFRPDKIYKSALDFSANP